MHVTVPERICKHCNQPRTVFRLVTSRICLKCHNRHKVAWYRKRPKLRMWTLAKQRSKRDELPFTITTDDFDIPERCPVLGIKLKCGKGIGGSCGSSPTLDKLIPSLGYVKGNVFVMSRRANAIKSDASPDEIEAVAAWVRKTLDNSPQV